ncbi:hypothetical protein [Microbulbifer sp. YPW1]|uniref:hypothetical protein n=1 Tax=unclassified Microbulbifer TaxID=2619833 RepID=UPI0015982ED7|nr:hypothetical protein [Microbulbifer sp. YPW1]QKX17591.1 hypothetical protein HUW35_11655 [Microbulbifer sp. YPW1]
MDILKKLSVIGFAALLVTGITACEKESGAEEVGETIDETVTDMGNAVEDACEDVKEKAGAEDQDC